VLPQVKGGMTQRVAAEYILSHIRFPTEDQLMELEKLVGEAQNGSPLGKADGSINSEAWTALRDTVRHFRGAIKCTKTFRERIS
jgi:hypothetical protein